ncbi:Dcm Site-specific DNA methylase [uncultured Caudovirales phage]|uniref:DNA (cytosine-5-)-methyltransferase n=1 Tax=uncultured Caudovirales phage TaxID=2100421 RepID=A0A6J5NXB8_9CAUD|nr:Dcm Site-specific DNA methylase [uncultured Caudovirales phage]
MNFISFGSVCSGIEAVSVALNPLGFEADWLAEIEPFPCAVLEHHHPETPNLGDMTKIAALIRASKVFAPDVLVGGTPCQAFSVAGMRAGLEDARGQLTISFMDLANAIDENRAEIGKPPAVVWWENVPGVLSDKTNAFGCFLAGLAGESSELHPTGGRWANAGCVFGSQRAIAWRVLDAQYFGVAQRRRRVFVVASARNGFDPAQILFEFEGVRRDIAPSRETGQEVAGTITTSIGRSDNAGSVAGQLISAARMVAFGEYVEDGTASTMKARDYKDATDLIAVTSPASVRRLTPTECERLQGFPDGYTLIPVKGKPASDAPRYKALGNSMAVPVMRWIGARIAQHLRGEQNAA